MSKIGVAGLGMSAWWSDAEGGSQEECEIKVPVRTYEVHLRCPVCKAGRMIYTGHTWPTGQPGHHHRCDKCGEIRAVRGETYPMIRHVPIVVVLSAGEEADASSRQPEKDCP